MQLSDYLQLSEEAQWDTLHDFGVQLASSETIEYDYLLFALHGFFVEVVFDNVIGSSLYLKAFATGPRLDKYLHSISF